LFKTTVILNEAGNIDYPYFWTSTTHLDGPIPGSNAVYISFGRALSKMHGRTLDVHGAGAQRSDPKVGKPTSRGPQGDMIRIVNFVRCVRDCSVKTILHEPKLDKNKYPNNIDIKNFELNTRNQRVDNSNRNRNNANRKHKRFPSRKRFVKRLDINGDSKVSKSEFDGPKDRFDYHDTNHDGYLSENEAPKHLQQ